MKPDYKNWMPKGMVCGFLGGTIAALAVTLIIGCTGLISLGILKTVLIVSDGVPEVKEEQADGVPEVKAPEIHEKKVRKKRNAGTDTEGDKKLLHS